MDVPRQFPLRVLVVDDDEETCALVRQVLGARPTGLVVVGESRTADGGVAQALRLQPDVVLLDLLLPGEHHGVEALHRLRLVCPRAAVVAYSAYLDLFTTQLDAADAVVPKGRGVLDLPLRLHEAAEHRRRSRGPSAVRPEMPGTPS